MNDITVIVRRQMNSWQKGTVKLDHIIGLHWSDLSGGQQIWQSDYILFGYVLCTQIIIGEEGFGHSGIHGLCPHKIKVCVLKKDNPDIYSLLVNMAGEKPPSKKRKPLTKEEKALRLYLMWGVPRQIKSDEIQDVLFLPEEYYTNSLILNFIARCKKRKLNGAILSPNSGIWDLDQKRKVDEKYLRETLAEEQDRLIDQVRQKLYEGRNLYIYTGRLCDRTALHKEMMGKFRECGEVFEVQEFRDIR